MKQYVVRRKLQDNGKNIPISLVGELRFKDKLDANSFCWHAKAAVDASGKTFLGPFFVEEVEVDE